MNPKEIKNMIDFIAKSGLEEVNIETEEFKIQVKRSLEANVVAAPAVAAVAPAPVAAAAAAPAPSAPAEAPAAAPAPAADNYDVVESPIVGTFYRSPNPDSDPFVEVGSTVKAGQTVCIVEAMKLMNEITSEYSGVIAEILIENGESVEFGTPLFKVKPA